MLAKLKTHKIEPRRGKKWAKRVARYLRKKYGDRCHWCGGEIDFSAETGGLRPSIEHLTQLSFGGTNDLSNLRLVHKKCNR